MTAPRTQPGRITHDPATWPPKQRGPAPKPTPYTILDTALIAGMDRLHEMARKRSESPVETLKAALDTLEATP